MSLRAMRYARACLRQPGCKLSPNARNVFLLLADSSNHETGLAFTGMWLADEAGIDMRTVRRAIHQLRDCGLIKLDMRHGSERCGDQCIGCRSSVVTFPTAAYLSTSPVTADRGEHTRAPDSRDRGPLSAVTDIQGSLTTDDLNSFNTEGVARELICCDGTGWAYNEDTDDVSPCPLHHPRGKAVGS